MPNSKNKPDPKDHVAAALVTQGERKIRVDTFIRRDLPETMGFPGKVIAECVARLAIKLSFRRDALSDVLERGRECEKNASGRTSVGYSKAYADKWEGIFGNKVGSDLPN
ncbi:hypothetical protein KJ657_00465 [Patescibacteria group bacterium]|nr:hypothetical protein [Patescibacteria group bacterium]MBU1015549.1 hypothetical protein [Patescibacteria group bacterium]MBU1685600.1 hypothetical protein [Patescibacteria group bacterium]MBU1938982.1 hypothetical protein [Patescibacteria group bacterium]